MRYLAVTKFWLQLGFAAIALAGAFLVHAAAAAPTVLQVELLRAEQDELASARLRFGDRFDALMARYREVRAVAAALDSRLCKVVLAYGESGEAARDCGRTFALHAVPGAAVTGDEARAVRAAVEEETEGIAARFARRLEAAATVESSLPDLVSFTPSASPLRGDDFVLVAPFGHMENRVTGASEFHLGIDLAAPAGAPVRATAAGRVTFVGRGSTLGAEWRRYGLLLGIRHGDRFVTVFGHLDAAEAAAGQEVRRGQRIGTVGATGWSVEPNLHYGVLRRRDDGSYEAVDPRRHILDYRWDNEQDLIAAAPPSADDTLVVLPTPLLR